MKFVLAPLSFVMLANHSFVMLAEASIFYTGVLLFSPAISLTSFGTR